MVFGTSTGPTVDAQDAVHSREGRHIYHECQYATAESGLTADGRCVVWVARGRLPFQRFCRRSTAARRRQRLLLLARAVVGGTWPTQVRTAIGSDRLRQVWQGAAAANEHQLHTRGLNGREAVGEFVSSQVYERPAKDS